MNYRLFLLLITSFCVVYFISNNLIVSDNLYYNSLSDIYSNEQIQEVLSQGKKWEWLTYIIIPLVCVIKCSLVALCLSIGLFLKVNKFEFGKLFTVCLKSEFIFLLPAFIKLTWFLFIQTSYSLRDLQYFSPLSCLNIFEPDKLETWLLYPLQILNLFELMYWVLLAYLLSKELPELDMNGSMTVVMSGYGTGLVIWVAFVMFLTLTYT